MLTGAGLSTDSGIPDYRGPGAAPRAPMTYQEFIGEPENRQRYWARNHIGWSHLRRADPNDGHAAVARLEHRGLLTGLITQNVDRLHEDAGSINVVDLHGRFDQVVAWTAGGRYTRALLAGSWKNSTRDSWNGPSPPASLKWRPTPTPPSRTPALIESFVVAQLSGLRRHPEARLRVLRRKRAQGPGGALLRHGGRGRGAAWWRARR